MFSSKVGPMLRQAVCGLLIAVLSWTRVAAVPVKHALLPDLTFYLTLQRQLYPAATVIGSFYDWRTVSKYRREAGLHLGYDIAMPAGTHVLAGWPGQVTAVAPWFGEEYGITVSGTNGFETTYGHLRPLVKVGDVVRCGDSVGITIIDHVDIKMRGPDGLYFDFGHGTPSAFYGSHPPLSRADEIRLYATSFFSVSLHHEERVLSEQDASSAHRALLAQRQVVAALKGELPRLQSYLEQGLIARTDVTQAQEKLRLGVGRMAALEDECKRSQGSSAQCGVREELARIAMTSSRARLHARGLSDRDIQREMDAFKRHSSSEFTQLEQMRAHASETARRRERKERQELEKARADMQRYDQLFEEGAVSRVERDRARVRYESLLKER